MSPAHTPGATSTPRASATPTPVVTSAASTLDVPALHLHATLVARPCADYEAAATPLPASTQAWFLDCAAPSPCPPTQVCGDDAIIAADTGVLAPLASAPAGTLVHIVTASGAVIDRVFDANIGHSTRYPDGTWPGHGVPPGTPLFAAIRGSSSQVERTGYAPAG